MNIYRKFGKRLLDIVIALPALIILLPVIAVTAVIVRIKMGSPVVFRHLRPGKDEKLFYVYKFRTMTDAKDAEGRLLPDKERLTATGKAIRRLSLDELPQLWNVLKGNMSLVGPRPLFTDYLPYYTQREKKRHGVRPGITGLAQTSGRNKVNWDERLELDVQYVENLSFLLDMKILTKTFWQTIRSEGVLVTPGTAVDPLHIVRQNQNISSDNINQP
ncbi:MAG: sugar transferase [Sedimentisphaerales bacterium]|nr:sugar transferase [Sedimentisphaerales bacterium]